VFRRFESAKAELRSIADKVKDLRAEGRPLRDVVVIARQWWPLEKLQALLANAGVASVLTKDYRRHEEQHEDAVTLTTLHSSKGLEYPVVLLVALNLLDTREEQFAEEVRLLYVGMTRATHELHLSASGASPFADSVEAAVARL
jgi:superfamily I DNA/RNA helicase